jgi:homocitrate synthase
VEASVTDVGVNDLNQTTTTYDESDDESSLADSSGSISDGPSFGGTSIRSLGSMSNFSIIDTTLREGEQFINGNYDTETKLKIARALDDIGVEYVSLLNKQIIDLN